MIDKNFIPFWKRHSWYFSPIKKTIGTLPFSYAIFKKGHFGWFLDKMQ